MNLISLAQSLTPLVGQRWPELKAVIETDFKHMFESEMHEIWLATALVDGGG